MPPNIIFRFPANYRLSPCARAEAAHCRSAGVSVPPRSRTKPCSLRLLRRYFRLREAIFWSLPLRWGRFAPRKARSCEHIQTRNAGRERQRGCFLCRFAGGASRLGKLAQASTDIGITAGREEQCFPAGEREARGAEGMFPLPLRWGLAFASRGKLALLDRKGNAGCGRQCFPAGEREARTAAGGIPFFFRTRRGGAFFRFLTQINIKHTTKHERQADYGKVY